MIRSPHALYVPIVVLIDWLTDWLALVLCTCIVAVWFGCFKRDGKINLRVLSIWLSHCGITMRLCCETFIHIATFTFPSMELFPFLHLFWIFQNLPLVIPQQKKEVLKLFWIIKFWNQMHFNRLMGNIKFEHFGR